MNSKKKKKREYYLSKPEYFFIFIPNIFAYVIVNSINPEYFLSLFLIFLPM